MDKNVYDEITFEPIEDPDLEKGFIYPSQRISGYTEETTKIMEDTDGLRYIEPSVPIYEECYLYHTYTAEDRENELEIKENELSTLCNKAISAGSTVRLSDGTEKKFSYAIEDQSNVSEMFNAVQIGASAYPYHADGESCAMYSAADIVLIYSTLSSLKTAQITYFNQLRQYLRSLELVPEIKGVQYGDPLTGEYLETYNTLIQQASEEMDKILSGVGLNVG